MYKQDLEEQSKVENLEFYIDNCKMNSIFVQKAVCKNGAAEGLTDAQVQILKEKCEGGGEEKIKIGADVKLEICMYKESFMTNAQILKDVKKKIPDITEDDINNVTC